MRLVFELLDVKKFWIFLTAPKLTYKWRGWTARQKRSWKLTWRSWKLTWTKTTVIEMLIYPFVLVRTISLNQSPETAGPKWSIPIVGLPLEESSKKEIPAFTVEYRAGIHHQNITYGQPLPQEQSMRLRRSTRPSLNRYQGQNLENVEIVSKVKN